MTVQASFSSYEHCIPDLYFEKVFTSQNAETMIPEFPFCKVLIHLMVDNNINEREVNCAGCTKRDQFYYPDGNPLFLKSNITDTLIETIEKESGSVSKKNSMFYKN